MTKRYMLLRTTLLVVIIGAMVDEISDSESMISEVTNRVIIIENTEVIASRGEQKEDSHRVGILIRTRAFTCEKLRVIREFLGVADFNSLLYFFKKKLRKQVFARAKTNVL